MEAWFAEIDRRQPPLRLDRGQLDLTPAPFLLGQVVHDLAHDSFAYPVPQPKLLDALRNDLLRTRCWPTSSAQLLVTHGAIGAIAASFQALCTPGDEILVPLPIWPAIVDLVLIAGAKPLFYPFSEICDAEELPDRLISLVGNRTRILFLNSPHNPTGLCLTPVQAGRALQVAKNYGLIVVSDEAYDNFGPEGHPSRVLGGDLAGSEEAILILSVSKRFAAPGLRLGFVRAPERLAERIWRISHLQTGGINSISQEVAARLLFGGRELEEEIQTEIARRRKLAEAALHARGIPVSANRGGFYMFFDLPQGQSGWKVARSLLAMGVGVVPGEIFGRPHALRVSLTVPPGLLEEGLERVSNVMEAREP